MRSLFAKTLLWFLATTAIAIAGILVTTALTFTSSESHRSPFSMLLSVQVEDARRAYEAGGKPALAALIARFQNTTDARIVITDAKGLDLLTGQPRPDLMKKAGKRPPPFTFEKRVVISRLDASRQYWLFLIDERRNWLFWFLHRQHLWIIGLVVLLCYAFAYHLTSPVRHLRTAVDRFGRGDFSARAVGNRRDEIGELAQSFNRMADRIETLVGAERRLLLDISHELRSPLARLSVAVELARSGQDRSDMLDRIQKEADRLNQLVGELLQVTRAEGDPSTRKSEPLRLDEMLGDLVYDSLLEAKAKDGSLNLSSPQPITILGDEELVRRAIENVIRNAIRHAPPGTAVDLDLRRVAGKARITVRDYGPGVPEQALARIFDAFYRVDSDRNRASGGVGLGLAIARRAVELHGGSLQAQNANPGLIVVIEFPARSETPAAQGKERVEAAR